MHFFSPANVMPLLEVVRTDSTSPATIRTVMDLAKPLRKTPVLAKVCYGFIGNRMMEGYAREAERMVLEGATPRQVDSALEEWGMAMGILGVFDMAGIDVGVNVHKANAAQYPPDPAYYQADFALLRSGPAGTEERQGLLPLRARQPRARRRSGGHRDPCGARARARHRAARSRQTGDRRALPVPAAERRLADSRRGDRAACFGHRRRVDCRLRVPALPRRADVLRGHDRPADAAGRHAQLSTPVRADALAAGTVAGAARRAAARASREWEAHETRATSDEGQRPDRDRRAHARGSVLPPGARRGVAAVRGSIREVLQGRQASDDRRDDRLLPRAQDRPRDVHGRQRVPDRREAHPERGSGRRRARQQRHHARVREHRSRTRARWACAKRAG